MGRNYFSEEEREELEKSKYVKKISEANVQFTEEFKSEFIRHYKQGNTPREIFSMFEINPNLLGKARIKTISNRIRKQSIREEGFSRKENSSKGKQRKERKPSFKNQEEELAYYKEYAIRLEQELDFTKKIKALESEYAVKHSKAKNMK